MRNEFFILALLIFGFANAQPSNKFGTSGDCNWNVNDNLTLIGDRKSCIDATFKIYIEGSCTGTLINRKTSDNNLGFYFLTAKHCVEGINFNDEHTLYFNYQSPDDYNSSVPSYNQGEVNRQSLNLTDNAYGYYHKTKLRLVDQATWGDFALCEILTPLPTHFNVTFAGWNPNKFYNAGTNLIPFITSYAAIHHPAGDIKKASGTHLIVWGENPAATGCYTITTVIDVLFGWLWGRRTSTQVICKYVDNPWFYVPYWAYGVVEPGSSGSGMFNILDRQIGTLSGGASSCNFPLLEAYGKLHSNYFLVDVKRAMNPENSLVVDLFGMSSRKISCYDNLELPGNVSGGVGHYFPASHYQADNQITIKANHISITKPIVVYDAADYTFKASNEIVIPLNFTVETGATFSAVIEPCSNPAAAPAVNSNGNYTVFRTPEEQYLIDRMKSIEIPKSKSFSIAEHQERMIKFDVSDFNINIFPNPSAGEFNLSITSHDILKNVEVEIYDMLSKKIQSRKLTDVKDENLSFSLYNQAPGVYFVKINIDGEQQVKRVVIQ